MNRFLLAIQFLTIVPIKIKGGISEDEMSESTKFFPVVGALQGLLAAGSALVLAKAFPPEIVSALVVLILILSNGGFHLDGLADTFDALAVKSSGDEKADRERRLAVMKDSSTGAIGVVSITLVILLEFIFIKNLFLINSSVLTVSSLLFLMPLFSRWAMVPAMYHGTSARREGLGRIFIDNSSMNTVVLSALLTAAFYILIVISRLYKVRGTGTIALFLVLISVLYIFSFLSAKFCEKKFDGLTGDTLGAIGEISGLLFLIVAALWLQRSF